MSSTFIHMHTFTFIPHTYYIFRGLVRIFTNGEKEGNFTSPPVLESEQVSRAQSLVCCSNNGETL